MNEDAAIPDEVEPDHPEGQAIAPEETAQDHFRKALDQVVVRRRKVLERLAE